MKERYSRQVLFKEIGEKGQKTLEKSAVAIIGVGALGSVSAELLARAGIGKLILYDNDNVDKSNLQRQALYTEEDIGKKKAIAAKEHLERINSEVKIEAHAEKIVKGNIKRIRADIIIDGTDNMETRFLLNEHVIKNKIPFIYGSAAGSKGIIFNVLPKGPCLNCILKNAKGLTSATEGIINPATYIVGSIQAAEALKIILNKNPSKEMIRFDVWKNNYDTYEVKKNPKCEICNKS